MMIRVLALLIAGLAPAIAGDLPDPALTPGDANPVLTRDKLCAPGFTTRNYRRVSAALKRHVYAAYGMAANTGACAGPQGCEVDHLISLELGGANTAKNLWPQPYDGPWNAHLKDKLENALHRLVCSGAITLEEAQQEIADDWVASYRRHMRNRATEGK